MGRRPNELTPYESPQHYLGAELRAMRVARGMSLIELGGRLHRDPSYLGKIERAERPIPAELVKGCDEILDAGGALVRLHELAEAVDNPTTSVWGQALPQMANNGVDVASQAGTLADRVTLPALLDTGAELVVAARTAEGRVIFVSVPRRLFLHGLAGSAAAGLAATPVAAAASLPLTPRATAAECQSD